MLDSEALLKHVRDFHPGDSYVVQNSMTLFPRRAQRVLVLSTQLVCK